MSHADAIHRFLLACPSQIENVVSLTGAGISAESGIPTFRGEEGYWTVGARVYQPQELATFGSFEAMPQEVWRWYLYRRAICRAAAPNAAHRALVISLLFLSPSPLPGLLPPSPLPGLWLPGLGLLLHSLDSGSLDSDS